MDYTIASFKEINMKQAVVALIIKDGLILSISRRNDKTKFGLIGGKVDEGETLEQALIREVKEESGITIKECIEILHRVEPKDRPEGEDFNTYCYLATEWIGTAHNSEEGEVAWLTEAELTGDNGAFADYNRETIKVYRTKFPTIK